MPVETGRARTAVTVVGAVLLAGLLLWLPGTAIARWTLPRAPRAAWLAAAPPISIGALFFVGSVLDRLSIPVSFPRFALPMLLVSAVAVLWRPGSVWQLQRRRPALGACLLLAAIAGAMMLWLLVVPSAEAVPPATDSANHGMFVRRIVEFATLDPATIIPDDLLTGEGHVAFYPFAIHLVAALLVGTTGCQYGARPAHCHGAARRLRAAVGGLRAHPSPVARSDAGAGPV